MKHTHHRVGDAGCGLVVTEGGEGSVCLCGAPVPVLQPMTNLRVQRRLAAAVLKVGKRRVFMDPNETETIATANSSSVICRLSVWCLCMLLRCVGQAVSSWWA